MAQLTFLSRLGGLFAGTVFGFAQALDMYLLRISQLSTVFALGDGTTFFLDLE